MSGAASKIADGTTSSSAALVTEVGGLECFGPSNASSSSSFCNRTKAVLLNSWPSGVGLVIKSLQRLLHSPSQQGM